MMEEAVKEITADDRRTLSEIASDMFGADYFGGQDQTPDPEHDGEPERRVYSNPDEAYNDILDARETAEEARELAAELEAEPVALAKDDTPAAGLSDPEADKLAQAYFKGREIWQQRAAEFAKLKSETNLNELAKTDKDEANKRRIDLGDQERALKADYDALVEVEKALGERVETRRDTIINAEKAKVLEYSPGFAAEANADYLRRNGLEDLIPTIGRAAVAKLINKARKYDKLKADQRPKKIPTIRKPKPAEPSAEYNKALHMARTRGETRDGVALLEARRADRARGVPSGPREMTVDEALAEHQKRGTNESGMAVIRAKRQQQARKSA